MDKVDNGKILKEKREKIVGGNVVKKNIKQESGWEIVKNWIKENKNFLLQVVMYTNFTYLLSILIPHLIKPGYPGFVEIEDTDALWVRATLRILIEFKVLQVFVFVNMVVLPLFVSLHPETRRIALSLLSGLTLSIFLSIPIATSYCSSSENPTKCQEEISYGTVPYGLIMMAIISFGGITIRRFLDKRTMGSQEAEQPKGKGAQTTKKPRVKRKTKKK